MAQHDIYNDTTPVNANASFARNARKPSISELRAAITGSGVAASYPTHQLNAATRNDLIRICKTHSITVNTTLV